MKKVIFSILALFTLISASFTVTAQSEVKEAELTYYGSLPSIDRKFTEVINPDMFLIYNSLGFHRSCIIAVNQQLEEIFRIKIEHGIYYPYFKYDAVTRKIVVIEIGQNDKLYQCYARVFDLTGKMLTQKTFKSPGNGKFTPLVKFSEDNNYFMIYSNTGKKGNSISYAVYDNTLSSRCTKELICKGNEQAIDAEINTKGDTYLVIKGSDNHMRFEKYNISGDTVKILKAPVVLGKKESYKDYQVKHRNDVMYASFAKHVKENFTGVDLFSGDFSKDTTYSIQSVNFTGENLSGMYADLKEPETSNTLSLKTETTPASLQNYYISNMLVEENRVFLISECLYKKSEVSSKKGEYPVYYAENMIISAFALSPDTNSWNKMISRKNQDKDNISNLAIQEWSAIKSETYLDKNYLNLLTLQPLKEDFSEETLVIRKINKDNGQIEKSNRLLKDSFIYDRNFTNWLDQFHLIIYRTNRATLATKFLIDIIEVD